MNLKDLLMITTMLCLVIATIYVSMKLRKVTISIEKATKEVKRQKKQMIRQR